MTKSTHVGLLILRARLAKLKASADPAQPWQALRRNQLRSHYVTAWNQAFARGNDSYRWLEHADKSGLRFAGYVVPSRDRHGGDKLTSNKNRALGWYSDNFQDQVYTAVVYQLPARDGVPQYLCGYADPNTEGVLLSMDIQTSEDDAQRHAAHVTKSFAEDAREGEAKDQAQARIEEAKELLASQRREFLALTAECRKLCASLADYPAMRGAIESTLRGIIAERAQAFATIETMTNNFWASVE